MAGKSKAASKTTKGSQGASKTKASKGSKTKVSPKLAVKVEPVKPIAKKVGV